MNDIQPQTATVTKVANGLDITPVVIPNPDSTTPTTALVPVVRQERTKVVNFAKLKPADQDQARVKAAQQPVRAMKLGDAVTFGVPEQAAIGDQLRVILEEFTRQTTPAAFAFVDQIDTFVKKDLKFEEIDELIRKSLEATWWTKTVDLLGGMVGMSPSATKRLKTLDEQVRNLLRTKVKTLGGFVDKLKEEFEKEVQRLIELGVLTDRAAQTYRDNIDKIRILAAAAQLKLDEGFADEERMRTEALASEDILAIADVKSFQMILRQFDNRALNLELEYGNTVSRIEKIGFARQAVAEQLSGKINGFQTTLNGISDALLTLAVAFEVRSAADSDEQWMKMNQLLSTYSTDLLDKSLTKAIQQQGLRNLAYAQMLKGTVGKLGEIGQHARAAIKEADASNETARTLISESVDALTKKPLAQDIDFVDTTARAKQLVHGSDKKSV